MTARTRRFIWIAAGSLVGIVALLVTTALFVVQTDSFRQLIRRQIIETVEKSTGGEVEISEFRFDLNGLRATLRDFVLHGSEPPGDEPLFRASIVVVEIKLLPTLRRVVDISLLDVTQPRVNVIVFPDGRTNIPRPDIRGQSDESPFETLVDLAVGRFQINDGTVHFRQMNVPFSARGENLRIELRYEVLAEQYRGGIFFDPLFLQTGSQARISIRGELPVTIGENRIQLENASLESERSRMEITGSIEDFASPSGNITARGNLYVPEVAAALGQSWQVPPDVPGDAAVDLAAEFSDERVGILRAQLVWGASSVDVTGEFRNATFNSGVLNVRGIFSIPEMISWLGNPPPVSGTLQLAGQVRLRSGSDYSASGSLMGRNLSFKQGNIQVPDAALASTFTVEPELLRLDPIRLDVAGGRVTGRGTLTNWNQYQVNTTVSGLRLQNVLVATGNRAPAWGATISGPASLQGQLKGVALQAAHINLSLVPNGRGIPLRGQVNATYDSARDSLDVAQSYITFPSSRLDFSGSINQRMTVRFFSQDLNDLRPAMALLSDNPVQEVPVRLEPAGSALLDATLMGRLSSPVVDGHVQVARFRVEDRRFEGLVADVHASRDGVSLTGGRITRDSLQVTLSASVGLRDWGAAPDRPLSADISVLNGDLRDALVLAGRSDIPVRGALTMAARVSGTLGNPQGRADFHVRAGEAYGEPLDSADGQLTIGGERVSVSSARVVSNAASVEVTGQFDHPPEDFTSGTLRGHIRGNTIALGRIAALRTRRPGLDGALDLDLDAQAILHPASSDPRLEVAAVNGTVGLRNVRLNGDALGDLSAQVDTVRDEVAFHLTSNFAGSSVQANGRTRLTVDYPTVADVNIRAVPLDEALKVAGKSNVDLSGLLTARGNLSGTWKDPEGDLTLELADVQTQGQKLDRVQGRIQYAKTSIKVPSLEVQAGSNRVNLEGSFVHPVQDFSRGDLKVSVATNSIRLAQIAPLQRLRPGLDGTIEGSIEAAGRFDQSQTASPIMLSSLSASVKSANLSLNGANAGSLSLSAAQSGSVVKVTLESRLAESAVRGTGEVQLAANYPSEVAITVKDVRYSKWASLLKIGDNRDGSFEVVAEGELNASGPLLQPANMAGKIAFSRLEASAMTPSRANKPSRPVALHNDGPIALTVTQAGLQIENARWTGPSTEVSVSGTIPLKPQSAMDVSIDANADLGILQDFDPDISSEGGATLEAAITGTLGDPRINGSLILRDAAYQDVSALNGVSKATGRIEFSGTRARIESLTATVGGGQVTVSGDVTRTTGLYRFDLQGRARGVRIRSATGASVTWNGTFQLKGTNENSLLSGDVDVSAVSFNARTDFGSILSDASPPQETPGAQPGLLDAMRLLVNVRMGSATTFRTTLAENLDATAELTVRGTVTTPGVLGRISIAQGEILFFGTTYSINEGTISFFNPAKIEPILNLNLATTARGVNIILVATGPVQNMSLAYQSDPPLQFSEIIALLAIGRLPTSDAVLVARQPATQPQTLPQMGASALIGRAVTNPIAGQLERVFGVSQLKIDPTFTSGSELPQMRLTIQQQITPQLTFTYITNLARSDPQIIRAEWIIDDDWSATATRQENGMVGLDLFYKKRFR